jgi:hypothetical protein
MGWIEVKRESNASYSPPKSNVVRQSMVILATQMALYVISNGLITPIPAFWEAPALAAYRCQQGKIQR